MKSKLFIGVDIGGTKILAGLISHSGQVLSRKKSSVPKKSSPQSILKTVSNLIKELLDKENCSIKSLGGIGLGVPGIVDPDKGKILVTPNTNLSGFALGPALKKKFKLKIALGNDVNLGVLGEKWLGAGKGVKNLVGIFPGTGVGGGIIINGQLLTGSHGAAAELGHIVMELNGPLCTCGNRGCLEAMTGRWAIERDIRQAVKNGQKTIVTKLVDGKLAVIKSKTLREALDKEDPIVTEIMTRVSQTLGLACISIRHLFDPEMIIFGGGIIEACGNFLLPIIRKVTGKDPLFSKIPKCKIVESQLGDDAVILGAVALVKKMEVL